MKSLWEQTIIPMYLDVMRDSLNQMVSMKYGEQYSIEYDVSHVTFLQESKTEMHERIVKEFDSNILSRNEARILLGYDEIEGEESLYNIDIMNGTDMDNFEEVEEVTEEEEAELKLRIINEG